MMKSLFTYVCDRCGVEKEVESKDAEILRAAVISTYIRNRNPGLQIMYVQKTRDDLCIDCREEILDKCLAVINSKPGEVLLVKGVVL